MKIHIFLTTKLISFAVVLYIICYQQNAHYNRRWWRYDTLGVKCPLNHRGGNSQDFRFRLTTITTRAILYPRVTSLQTSQQLAVKTLTYNKYIYIYIMYKRSRFQTIFHVGRAKTTAWKVGVTCHFFFAVAR